MTREEMRKALRDLRGIYDPCDRCQGMGVCGYSSTATWRGGVGGQAFTSDICSVCWGSGDKSRPWLDLRKLETKQQAWEESQVLEYLSRRLGCGLSKIPERILQLADLCEKQANRRKLPEGEHAFWWNSEWHMLAQILKSLISKNENDAV